MTLGSIMVSPRMQLAGSQDYSMNQASIYI